MYQIAHIPNKHEPRWLETESQAMGKCYSRGFSWPIEPSLAFHSKNISHACCRMHTSRPLLPFPTLVIKPYWLQCFAHNWTDASKYHHLISFHIWVNKSSRQKVKAVSWHCILSDDRLAFWRIQLGPRWMFLSLSMWWRTMAKKCWRGWSRSMVWWIICSLWISCWFPGIWRQLQGSWCQRIEFVWTLRCLGRSRWVLAGRFLWTLCSTRWLLACCSSLSDQGLSCH